MTDSQPYDILLRSFANPDGEETTWYDAADLYKAWAKKQFWHIQLDEGPETP